MALNRASDALAAVWLSQTQVTNYRDFSRVVIRFFSVVEMPRTPVSIIEYYYYYAAVKTICMLYSYRNTGRQGVTCAPASETRVKR